MQSKKTKHRQILGSAGLRSYRHGVKVRKNCQS